MGTIIDHAIIVTGAPQDVERAHAKASTIFHNVTSIVDHEVNGGQSFLVPPDGSKIGWPSEKAGTRRRHEFKQWLRHETFCWLEWLEVRYGEKCAVGQSPGVVAGSGHKYGDPPASDEWFPDTDDETEIIDAEFVVREPQALPSNALARTDKA